MDIGEINGHALQSEWPHRDQKKTVNNYRVKIVLNFERKDNVLSEGETLKCLTKPYINKQSHGRVG